MRQNLKYVWRVNRRLCSEIFQSGRAIPRLSAPSIDALLSDFSSGRKLVSGLALRTKTPRCLLYLIQEGFGWGVKNTLDRTPHDRGYDGMRGHIQVTWFSYSNCLNVQHMNTALLNPIDYLSQNFNKILIVNALVLWQ
jgi:hypothetical protein